MNQEHLTLDALWELPEEEQCKPEVLAKVTSDDLKKILKEFEISQIFKEAIITELKKHDPDFELEDDSEMDVNEDEMKYPALNTISTIYKILGWVIIVGGIFGAVATIANILTSIIILVATIFVSILSFAAAESIKVITDISSFSYQILKHLKSKE